MIVSSNQDNALHSQPATIESPSWSVEFRAVVKSIARRLKEQSTSCKVREQLAQACQEPLDLPKISKLGRMLLDAQEFEEAEYVYRALADYLPTIPLGFAGLAQSATRRASWPEALARWDGLISRFADRIRPEWIIERAAVLAELDRKDEAELELRKLLDDAQTRQAGLAGLARLCLRASEWPEALVWAEALRDQGGEQHHPHRVALRAQALAELGRLDEAEQLYRGMAGQAETEMSGMIGLAGILASAPSLVGCARRFGYRCYPVSRCAAAACRRPEGKSCVRNGSRRGGRGRFSAFSS